MENVSNYQGRLFKECEIATFTKFEKSELIIFEGSVKGTFYLQSPTHGILTSKRDNEKPRMFKTSTAALALLKRKEIYNVNVILNAEAMDEEL